MSAFLKLRGDGPSFLLESAEQGKRFGRYSFIGFRPHEVLRWTLADGGDPYAIAAAAVGRYSQAPQPGLPPFSGGAVGFFGYDLVRTVEPLGDPGPDQLGLPDMALMLSDALVVFDHLKHTVMILANVYGDEDPAAAYAEAAATIEEVRARLDAPLPRPVRPPAARRRRLPAEHDTGALRGDRRADRRVHLRGRRLPGRAVAALVGADRGRRVLDLPRPARHQPEPVHVLPGLRRLPGRRRESRAADHGHRP